VKVANAKAIGQILENNKVATVQFKYNLDNERLFPHCFKQAEG